MRQIIKKGVLFFIVFFLLLGSVSAEVYATEAITDYFENDYMLGKLSAIYYGDGNIKTFQVMVQENHLYVDAENWAEKLGMTFAVKDGNVQILLEDNWRGERIANFKMNSTRAWYYNGVELLEYEMPFRTIENDEGYWIPLRFAIKMMGSEMVLVGSDIYIAEFHETMANVVDHVNETYFESQQIILGLGRFYDGYSETEKQVMLAELREKDWVQQVMDVWDARGADGVNYEELATFLVSNYSPEFFMDSKHYLELLNIYVAAPILKNNAAEYDETSMDVISILTGKVSASEVAQLFYDSIIDLEENNAEILYNNAYNQIYKDTIGLDPVTKEWSEDNIRMDEWIAEMNSYGGIASNYTTQIYDSVTSILNVPDACSNAIGILFNELAIFKNINAENAYAMTLFDRYLNMPYTKSADDELYAELRERVDDYGKYMVEYQNAYLSDALMLNPEESMDDIDEDIMDEMIDDVLGENVGTIWGVGKSILTFGSDIQEAREKDFEEYSGNYSAAKMLSRGLRKDVNNYNSAELAYLYYKTDAIALNFIYKALKSTEENFFDSDVDKLVLMSDVNRLIEEECYHMSIVKMGINYGLQEEDNEAYNEVYNDANYLPLVVKADSIMGNTNGNMNAGGFACESENYYVEVSDTFWEDLEWRIVDKDTDEAIGDADGIGWWVNLYEDGENVYLYFISNRGEIRCTNVNTWETIGIRSGQNKKLMIYDGYLYYQEGSNLYRREMTQGSLVGEEEIVLLDVGECIAYIEDDIYYSNVNAEVCRYSLEEGCILMGIYSTSFDFMDGTMYYANLNDSNTIYAYNELLGVNEQVEATANCTFLNVNGKQLYYKVDDNYNEGLVYVFTPYVNTSRAVVYACYNPGAKSAFPSEYYQWNSSGCRIFNVSNGTIYNEGALRCISPFTSYGFSVKNVLMHFVYNVSQKLD